MKKSKKERIIAVTLGDPDGIGTEITSKALKERSYEFPILLIGKESDYPGQDYLKINDINKIRGSGIYFLNIMPGKKDPSFEYVKKATDLALERKICAIVTAPISKEKWINSGINYPGHTNYFVKRSNVKKWAMFFWSSNMKVALLTTHIPLKNVFNYLKRDIIIDFCRFVNTELEQITGEKQILFMSGLNPHAGEGGNLGHEEIEIISPVVEKLKEEMEIHGPYPPDTVFLEAAKVVKSVVIALYHDQGLIPFKLLNINSGVNVTLGLPFIRTSPDHGTAQEIKGKNIANPSSMIEALSLAAELVKRSK